MKNYQTTSVLTIVPSVTHASAGFTFGAVRVQDDVVPGIRVWSPPA